VSALVWVARETGLGRAVGFVAVDWRVRVICLLGAAPLATV
jgi:hypothetical protein